MPDDSDQVEDAAEGSPDSAPDTGPQSLMCCAPRSDKVDGWGCGEIRSGRYQTEILGRVTAVREDDRWAKILLRQIPTGIEVTQE